MYASNSSFITADIPSSFKEAGEDPSYGYWIPGIYSELATHDNNATWTLVPRSDTKIIWQICEVYKMKESKEDYGNIVENQSLA